MKKLFYLLAIIGFFFPYFLQISLSGSNEELKIFAITLLPKFNLVYFAILIVLFFVGLKKEFARITMSLFVIFYFAYTMFLYFIYPKIDIQNYIKNHNLKDVQIVKITELKNIPNFKLIYKSANLAIIKKLPKEKHTQPFNYKKDRGY